MAAKTGAERIKAWRKRQKELKNRALNVYLSKKSYERLQRLGTKYNLSIAETLSAALKCMELPGNKVEIESKDELAIQGHTAGKKPQKISLERNEKGIYQLRTVGDIRIVIEHIYALRKDGLSYRTITEHLNSENIPTFTGRPQWSPYTVRQLFKKPNA